MICAVAGLHPILRPRVSCEAGQPRYAGSPSTAALTFDQALVVKQALLGQGEDSEG